MTGTSRLRRVAASAALTIAAICSVLAVASPAFAGVDLDGESSGEPGSTELTGPASPEPVPGSEFYLEPPFLVGQADQAVPGGVRAIVLSADNIRLLRGGQLVQQIPIPPGPLDFADVAARIASPRWINEIASGVFEVRAAIVQTDGSDLRIVARTVDELRLTTDPGVFLGGDAGRIQVQGVSITSWDLVEDAPAAASVARPFVRYEGTADVLFVDSEFAFLGTDPVGPGVTIRGSGVTANILRSVIHDNIVGLTISQQSRAVATGLLVRDNRSDGVVIESGSEPIVSASTFTDNRGAGVRMSATGADLQLSDNIVKGNTNGGIVGAASSRGQVATNLVEDNAGPGIDIDSVAGLSVVGNRIRGHGTGLRIGGGAASDTADIRNNVIENSDVGVLVEENADDVELSGTRITSSTETGIRLAGSARIRNTAISGSPVGIEIARVASVQNTTITAVQVGMQFAERATGDFENVAITAEQVAFVTAEQSAGRLTGDSRVSAAEPATGPGQMKFDDVEGVGSLSYGVEGGAARSIVLLVILAIAVIAAILIYLVRRLPNDFEPDAEADEVNPLDRIDAQIPDPSPLRTAEPEPAVTEERDAEPDAEPLPEPTPEPALPAEFSAAALSSESAWTLGNALASAWPGQEIVVGTSNRAVAHELAASFAGGAVAAGASVVPVGAAGREATLYFAEKSNAMAALLVSQTSGVTAAIYHPNQRPLSAADATPISDLVTEASVNRSDSGTLHPVADAVTFYLGHVGESVSLKHLESAVVRIGVGRTDDLLAALPAALNVDYVAREVGESDREIAARLATKPVDVGLVQTANGWVVVDETAEMVDDHAVRALLADLSSSDRDGGLIAGLQLAALVSERKTPLSALAAGIERSSNSSAHAHLTTLRDANERLLAAARTGDPTDPVPGCPDWDLSALVSHTGRVQASVRLVIEQGLTSPIDRDSVPRPPADWDDMLAWFRDESSALESALQTLDLDQPIWSFIGDVAGSFWPRRMAAEALVHAYDAERAATSPQPIDDDAAYDALVEAFTTYGPLFVPDLEAFVGAFSVEPDGQPAITVVLDPGDFRVIVDDEIDVAVDATVKGRAADLLWYFWRHPADSPVVVDGNQTIVDAWVTR